MPCRISTGVHERINVVPTVPAWYPVNLQASEQSGIAQWGEKTPWSFTAACSCDSVIDAEHRQERRCVASGWRGATVEYCPFMVVPLTRIMYPGTPVGGQFGWGGTSLKTYQRGPIVGSGGTETLRRVQEHKPA